MTVEVLHIDWKPGMESAKVVGVRVGDVANRPVTFNLRPVDAVTILDKLALLPQDTTEELELEIEERFLIPIIRRGYNPEPVPGTSAT